VFCPLITVMILYKEEVRVMVVGVLRGVHPRLLEYIILFSHFSYLVGILSVLSGWVEQVIFVFGHFIPFPRELNP
jgi:hypothetical protein